MVMMQGRSSSRAAVRVGSKVSGSTDVTWQSGIVTGSRGYHG